MTNKELENKVKELEEQLSTATIYHGCEALVNELRQENQHLKDQVKKSYQEGLLQKQFDKDMEIQELKDKIEFLTTFKEVISEHKPAFCKLAGRDCEWLGKEKQLAIEVLTMFEAILSRAIQWDNNYKCWTISEEVFGNIIMQIDEKIEELKGEE